MQMIDPKDWIFLYGGAIIGIAFSFLASLTVELYLRKQELELCLKKVELKDALKETTSIFNWVRLVFAIFLIITLAVIIGNFILTSSSPQATGNVTIICENCSYPTTTIINNNYYNFTEINCLKNSPLSLKELKYLMKSSVLGTGPTRSLQ